MELPPPGRGLARSRGKLLRDQLDQVADGLERLKFGGLELDMERGFNGDDQVDVIEGVPLGDVAGGKTGREHKGVIVKQVVKDGCELRVDVLLGQHAVAVRCP